MRSACESFGRSIGLKAFIQQSFSPPTTGKWIPCQLILADDVVQFTQQVLVQVIQEVILQHSLHLKANQADVPCVDELSNNVLTDLRKPVQHQFVGDAHDPHHKIRELVEIRRNDIVEELEPDIGIKVTKYILECFGVGVLEIHSNKILFLKDMLPAC
ncbi:hypothetical protein HYQ44_014494 [Verticillium longisporum]|nr:hypothetical protein HYQ44_014494 [Verticillium longisporum]